ncbi:winged helix-turn-helix domain-containing protein [Sporolactobacillus vineae]|uniref:winged helix-turn-helix domain-containing protein n=1 Tax=Sporolactobacillus vineae TaxID=444463 RepID=UPI0002899388|nr:winged helix-turn-helix domain-containing protein [Sporolactobacillus vineae]
MHYLVYRELLKQVWGGQMINTDSNYFRVYIGHIRKKIEENPTQPKMILTEPGVGYRFVE